MSETPLLDWKPAPILGSTFSPDRDGSRLNAQGKRVYAIMKDGKEHTLSELATLTGDPAQSISARLRDIRRTGITVDKRHVGNGLWLYRMVS